jgi:hypothetical protein
MHTHLIKSSFSLQVVVANMASYVIYLSLILVIHENMTKWTNHIVEHVFVDISRSQGCKNDTCQNKNIVCIFRV